MIKPVYLDTETTGLHNSAEIVEICVLDHAGNPLVDSLVRPKGRIPADATRVHGITDTMTTNAPTWAELWPQVESALTGQRVAIYNADYDVRLMTQSHRLRGLSLKLPATQFVCVMKLYAQFHGERDYRSGEYRWQALEKAGMQCGIKLPNAHRAKADALLARAILHFMAERKR